MKLSQLLGITLVAAVASTEANAAFFGSDNFLAPVKGSSRGASGWVIDPNALAANRGNAGPSAQGQAAGVLKTMNLAAGESDTAGASHRNSGYFQDNYGLTLAEDSAVSVDLQDKVVGALFNTEKLTLSLTDAAGALVAQAGEGESFVTSMLEAGDYTVSVTGLSQAVKGSVYNFRLEAPGALAAPIPAAAWLFGSALAALIGVARRRKV